MTEPPIFKIPQALKEIAEVFTIFGALVYVAGFIIVNSHFLSFGYTVTPLFRIRYFSAGFLFVVLCAFVAASVFPIYWSYRESQKQPSSGEKDYRLTYVMLAGLGITVYIFKNFLNEIITEDIRGESEEIPSWAVTTSMVTVLALLIFEFLNGKRRWFPKLLRVEGLSIFLYCTVLLITSVNLHSLGFAAGVLGFMACLAIYRLQGWTSDEWIVKQPMNLAGIFGWWILSASFTISSFSTSFYPYVKPQFGGGQLSRIRVILAEHKDGQIAKLGFQKPPVDLLAEAQLLDSTDNEFLIVVKSAANDRGVLLQLERSMVDTIMYFPPQ